MVLEKSLESPFDYKVIKPVHPKGNQPWIFIGRTGAEAEAPILWHLMWRLIGLTHWKRPWCWKDWRQEKKGMTEDGMGGWHHWFDGHEFEQSPGIGDGQGSLACCSPRSCKESDMTEWRHCTEPNCAQPYQMEEPLKVHPCLPRFKQRQGLRFKWFFYICITPLTSLELIILFFWVSFYLPDCWSGILWNANSAQKKKVI